MYVYSSSFDSWLKLNTKNENHARIKYGTCEKNMHCNQSKGRKLYIYVIIINNNN